MLKKYCSGCYWRIKRAAERECGLPELHGRGRSRACPICKSYAALSTTHSEMPPKRRFIEMYTERPICAISKHAFNPATDPEQLLPTPVRRELTQGFTEENLVFVVRFIGNSMRNGHSTFAQCAEAYQLLAQPSQRVV
jgi:hypothetical protein